MKVTDTLLKVNELLVRKLFPKPSRPQKLLTPKMKHTFVHIQERMGFKSWLKPTRKGGGLIYTEKFVEMSSKHKTSRTS